LRIAGCGLPLLCAACGSQYAPGKSAIRNPQSAIAAALIFVFVGTFALAQDANAPSDVPEEPNEPAAAATPAPAKGAKPAAAGKPAPWHLPDWPCRVELRYSGWPGDVACGYVRLYGRAAADAHDVRIIDANGQPVNFIIRQHRPDYVTTLQVHVPRPGPQTQWLYYGNPDAPKIDTQHCNPKLPAWQGRAAVATRIWRKAKPGHPGTLAELKAMVAAAGEPEGWDLKTNSFLGPNPFGESDNFLTHMEGWLHLDKAGKYKLRLYADDGAWLVVDGREVLAWPGPRAESEWRSIFGPPGRDVELDLTAGEHHVEIWHEEGEGLQMCSLAWSPPWPWTEGGRVMQVRGQPYYGVREIPQRYWGNRRIARAGYYEARARPLVCAPSLDITYTYWVPDSEQQMSMATVGVATRSSAGRIVRYEVLTDDGTLHVCQGEPKPMYHVFFSNGPGFRRATFTVVDEKGNRDTLTIRTPTWQINVGHTARVRLPKGTPQAEAYLDYFKSAPPYDVSKLLIDDLVGYALFWYTFDQDAKAAAAVGRLLKDKPDHPAMGELALKCFPATIRGGWDAELALKLLESIGDGTALAARIRAKRERLAKLNAGEGSLSDSRWDALDLQQSIAEDERFLRELPLYRAYVLAWGKEDYKAALAAYEAFHDRHAAGTAAADAALARRSLFGKADVLCLQGDYAAAEKLLRELEKSDPRRMSPAEKLAKIGGFPYTIDDFLSRDLPRQALETVDQWEDIAPLAKLKGLTYFYRGKAMYVDRPSLGAVKCLDLAERVSPGAVHAPEAAWLKANCLMEIGRYEQAIVEFARLRDEMASSEHLKQVPDKIEQCRKKLAERKGAASKPGLMRHRGAEGQR